jgi:hypothetical protein
LVVGERILKSAQLLAGALYKKLEIVFPIECSMYRVQSMIYYIIDPPVVRLRKETHILYSEFHAILPIIRR